MGRKKQHIEKRQQKTRVRASPSDAYVRVEMAAGYFNVPEPSIRTLIDKYEIDYAPHFGKPGIVRLADLESLFDKLAKCRRWNKVLETEWLKCKADPKLKKLPESQQWHPGPPPARLENLPHYRCAGLYRLVEIPTKELIGPGLGEVKTGAIMLYTLDGEETVCIVTKLHDRGLDAVALDCQEYGHYPCVIFKNIPAGFLRNRLFPPVRVRSQAVLGEVVGYTTVNREALPCVVTKVEGHSIIDGVIFGNERGSLLENRSALPVWAPSQVRIGKMMLCAIVNREVFPCMVTKACAQPFVDAVIFTNHEYGSYPNHYNTFTVPNIPLEELKDC
jgi:hypothetical protein